MIYSFSKTIPRSSNPVIFTGVPIGKSSGVGILPKKPDTLMPESSNSITTQAYGANSSNPAGGTVIIVYVTTFPVPFRIVSSNSLLPHDLQ